ncbi:MAG: glycosyltransferase [Scrofimicrobium sp.]
MKSEPRFSLVTPVYKPRPDHLQLTIDSVLGQEFRDWEWILVDDASGDAEVLTVLRNAASNDNRLKLVERSENGHIVRASNDGLAKASGEWIVLLDHDDLLVPTSLAEIDRAIKDNPLAGYVYSDEDKVDDAGNFSGEFRKPDWSPERLRHQMYLGHLSALRHDLVREVGGFHEGFDGSQDHDLALRVTELSDEVAHIPEILYHWRMVPGSAAGDPSAKDYATVAGMKAVQEHLERIGLGDWKVGQTSVAHTYSVERTLDPTLRVSVVIPTRGTTALIRGEKRELVTENVRSLLSHTQHQNLEVVIVHDRGTPQSTLDELQAVCGSRLVTKEYDAPFNFSEKCNLGFLASTGDIVVFLNDDMEIISSRFIDSLCAPLREPDVGMTGARLDYSDGRIQHAGLVIENGQFMHAYLGYPHGELGYFGELVFDHEVSGLTAACVAMRREVFRDVGGFNLALPSNFNDVDLSLKVRSLGLRLVWLAETRALHFESLTRDTTVNAREVWEVVSRWGKPVRDNYMPFDSRRQLARLEAASLAPRRD